MKCIYVISVAPLKGVLAIYYSRAVPILNPSLQVRIFIKLCDILVVL